MESFEKQLFRADKLSRETGGRYSGNSPKAFFGMTGDMGKLKEIVSFKEKYQFRLLVDDAHGFGTMGKTGAGQW